MILVDTGALVALIDPRDRLHRRSRADLAKLTDPSLFVTMPVLTETFFHLCSGVARRRLRALLGELEVSVREIAGKTSRTEKAVERMLARARDHFKRRWHDV